ncbi:hypothetical protein BU23DRAFT_92957 [Bimuria novae-zelandiae CBS 107.79]|uniref:C2H2-type domain-containing protein n=1 Tax=Bimuria novae-zelandiae CBS 107.79 TaxID=1447943 RepID=A0A6A5VEU5_9PLEO|nr:hypothetical protein BU23DRAFT_92957 [Bimuria novae-zelandiae CBS 107.79]
MFDCEVCNREFINFNAACQHMNALGHWGCEGCSVEFWSQNDAEDHMDDYGHRRPRFECEACDATFETFQAARYHMDANNHWRNHWCRSCKRGFQNENNLRMHLNSKVHKGDGLGCPFCRRAFTTATGIAHHLETGSCPNARNIDHASILRELRRRDPHHVITKKLLTHPSSTPTDTTVTPECWNGYGYECYICHSEFTTLRGLHQHVNSAVHRQKVYHCPGRTCHKEFTSLAGLFNHLESETCGTVRFDTVQRNVGHFLNGRSDNAIGFY